jgi:hypothetical protein
MSYLFVGSAVVSIGTAFIGANAASKGVQAQIQAQKDITSANLAADEKYKYDVLRTEAENQRLKIVADTMTSNRSNLYTQSTQRLKDTSIYVVAVGVSVGIVYGVSLISSKD